MEQWEHTICSSIATANELGLQGWEAVGFYNYGRFTILMKRKIPK